MGGDTWTVGSYLSRRRLGLGLTQQEIAEAMGYGTAQFISNWERNISTPPLATVNNLCRVLKLDPKAYLKVLRRQLIKEIDARLDEAT